MKVKWLLVHALSGEGMSDGDTVLRKSRYAVGGVSGVLPPLVNDPAGDGTARLLSLGLRRPPVVGVGRLNVPPASEGRGL